MNDLVTRELALRVVLSCVATLALGLWIRAMVEPQGGPFASTFWIVGLALGVGAGQVVGTLLARRQRRR
jgi:hypothetical protein